MDLAQLRLFEDVSRLGSFASAAQAAGVDPSAVSRAIAALEAALGVRLFERTTRRVTITEAGERFRARVAPLLQGFDEAVAEARDLVDYPRGQLRISASTAFGQVVVVPMLGAYSAANPEVDVDLLPDDRPVDLVSDRIDLAIRHQPDAAPDFVVSRLINTSYRVVASPDYLAGNPLPDPESLGEHPCLRFPFPGFRDRWRFRRDGVESTVAVGGRIVVAGALALHAAVLRGLGPALLADWLVGPALRSGDLIDVFPDHEVTATDFESGAWILYPSRSYLPLKTRRFIEALRRHAASSEAD